MESSGGLLRGKRGLIMGLANNRSIAWGIAKACHQQGAELAFTYQGDALKKRVEPLAEEVGGLVVGHCDVAEGATIDAAFAELSRHWDRLDFLVHAIGFSDKDELTGRYLDTSESNFTKTMLISVYSLTAVAHPIINPIEFSSKQRTRLARGCKVVEVIKVHGVFAVIKIQTCT